MDSSPSTKGIPSSPLGYKKTTANDTRKRYSAVLYSSPLRQSTGLSVGVSPVPQKSKSALSNELDISTSCEADRTSGTQELIDLLADLDINERLRLMSAGSDSSLKKRGNRKSLPVGMSI